MNKNAIILIVDDSPELLLDTSRVLGQAGYKVLQASTGHDSLRLAKESMPDLILLDVVLPDTDGIQVCKRIKSDPSLADIHVVLISASKTATQEQAEGLDAGEVRLEGTSTLHPTECLLPKGLPHGGWWGSPM